MNGINIKIYKIYKLIENRNNSIGFHVPNKLWQNVYFRSDCDEKLDEYGLSYRHKNLAKLGRELSTIVMVDENNINNTKMRNNNKDKHALDFSSSPFGKGKIIQNNNSINNPNKIKQNNGTNVLQYNNNDASDIRGFDIGSIKWIVVKCFSYLYNLQKLLNVL